jgi:hypothetical protein
MSIITSIFTGILIAAISSWITVQLSLRRYHAERWWDRKVDAYKTVLEALHESKALSDHHLFVAECGAEINGDIDKKLRGTSQCASDNIQKAMDLGSFFLSDEALARLKRFRREESEAQKITSWHEHLEGDWNATDSCLKDMAVIAKNDLRPESIWPWRKSNL